MAATSRKFVVRSRMPPTRRKRFSSSAFSGQFVGDVLYVREDETAYLSAIGRGGDRAPYALASGDVRFCLETHGLIASPRIAAA